MPAAAMVTIGHAAETPRQDGAIPTTNAVGPTAMTVRGTLTWVASRNAAPA